ncbi:hypothetical protein D2915_01235 [Klebsiella pneumoniae]|nr:hypothetical protein [Klebsiella pneumoniae]
MFGESGFAHGDLLQEHNQYAGRSLNVNGPLYRDAYTHTATRSGCENKYVNVVWRAVLSPPRLPASWG